MAGLIASGQISAGIGCGVEAMSRVFLGQAVTPETGNPYPDGSPGLVTVAFLTKAAPADAKKKVAAMATEAEPFTFAGSEVYVHYSNGQGKSKLAERFSSVIGVSATVRNINTVTKILALCERAGN